MVKELLKDSLMWLGRFGINPFATISFVRGMPSFLRDLQRFRSQAESEGNDFPLEKFYPCMQDAFVESGSYKGHYFHQDLLVARRIFQHNPERHVDFGSRVDGFVAHVASYRPIEVFDIRPLTNTIPNIKFIQADLMSPIPSHLREYCDSLSCLHVLEHLGLGRYGDPINVRGHLMGLENLRHIVKVGGKFYFSTPIGPQRIEFNAHRVFSVRYLLEQFQGKYQIDQFSFVDDKGDLHEDVPLLEADIRNEFGCRYGCGIFEMTKL